MATIPTQPDIRSLFQSPFDFRNVIARLSETSKSVPLFVFSAIWLPKVTLNRARLRFYSISLRVMHKIQSMNLEHFFVRYIHGRKRTIEECQSENDMKYKGWTHHLRIGNTRMITISRTSWILSHDLLIPIVSTDTRLFFSIFFPVWCQYHVRLRLL